MLSHRFARASMLAVLALSILAVGPARAATACSAGAGAGGDWPVYGRDATNSRSQSDEHSINAANADSLTAAWTFSSSAAGGTGAFDGTPTEAEGCVFVGSETGWVFALNAETGALGWKTKLDSGIFSSLTIADGKVFAAESITSSPYTVGPRVAALDLHTGEKLWETVVNDFLGSDLYASPTVKDGMVIIGVGANSIEGTPDFHGSVVFLDESTGKMIHRTWVIPPSAWDQGNSGGGVWGTLAFDNKGYAYTGTGNPFNSAREYGTTNAIIKIDVDRTRSTFGEIVATYKGLQDQYVAQERTACKANEIAGEVGSGFLGSRFATCEFLDLDFGGSVNLFMSHGRLLAGANQKGLYHAVDAATMAPAWTSLNGAPIAFTGATSAAVANGVIYGSENPPNWVYAMDASTGTHKWDMPHTGPDDWRHYQPTSVANGVVYQLDGNGILNVYAASDGTPLLVKAMTEDVGGIVTTQSGGVSIARHKVFAAADQYLIAYHTAV